MRTSGGEGSGSNLHFRNVGWNEQIRFRHRHDFGNGDAGRGFLKRYPSVGETDHRHIGNDEVDRPRRGQRQGAPLGILTAPPTY